MTPHPRQAHTAEPLEQRIAYLELLNEFSREILKVIRTYSSNPAFSAERCLQELVNFTQKKFDIYSVDVLLLDEDTAELGIFVHAGHDPIGDDHRSFRLKADQGVAGQCMTRGETIIVNDIKAEPAFVAGPFKATRAKVSVPIQARGRVIGVLDVRDREEGRFNKDFASVLEDVSLDIGFMLENRKLYEDLRTQNQVLEKRAENKVDELRKSEERYRTIVENTSDPIFIIDFDGRFTWVNRAACTLLGYENDQILARNISSIVKKGFMHPVFTALREAKQGRSVRGVHVEVVTQGGQDRTLEFAACPLKGDGVLEGVEITTRDVTEKIVIEKLKKNYLLSLQDAVDERTAEIKDTQRAAILAIANLAESIDEDTGGHIQRIQYYSKILAEELQNHPKYRDTITDEYIELIRDLSPLHDLGKVGIRDYILQKTDKLTEDEFEKMKEHTTIGAHALRMAGEMIHRESIFAIGEMIARFHHEKWDGTGYPAVDINGEHRPLRGDEIPLCARLVAMADVYDALTSKRPYKMPFPHERARDMVVAQSGKHFDPDCVQAFLRREKDFMKIRLSFPDNIAMPEGKPFELPARDRA